jgi:hypothetical protein
MYLTTETEGLWYSSNITSSTPTFSAVTSYPFRQPERVFFNPYNPNEIWITSFGNGLRVGTTCGFSMSPRNQFFLETGGGGIVQITAPNGCAWTAASNENWITITSANSGAGSGVVTFEVRENFTGSSRLGTLSIAGQTFTVFQDAGLPDCTYSIFPMSAPIPPGGGTGSFSVASGELCAWVATSDVSWTTITSGNMGIGNGIVNYLVAANTTGRSRKGRITVGGQVFTVKQK